jgi:hypothetical protein
MSHYKLFKLFFMPSTLIITLLIFAGSVQAQAPQTGAYWPKVIPLKQLTITIYQPELEKFSGNTIHVRAAFNIFDGTRLPIFGALWFSARVAIDRHNNTVFYDNIHLVDVNFPDITTAKKQEFRDLLASVTPTWQLNSNLNDFSTAVDIIGIDEESSTSLNNSPPNIFYEQTPAELVFIDGEPILENIDNSDLYQYVVNTPYFIVRSSSDKYYYLLAGQWWFRARKIYDNWQNISAPPQSIVLLSERSKEHNNQNNSNLDKVNSSKPKLIVTIHPASLILTFGDPELVSIPGTSLLYISNTNNDLLKDDNTGEFYVLFSGRWYKSKTLYRGDWHFVAPADLPVYFKKIPLESKIGHVRLSIPGTPESISTALDNAIPQTAIVDRKTAKISVDYDGEPIFEPIAGTTLQYAVNTGLSVLKTAENKYYAVDEAVWFTANSPADNWVVATEIPEEVKKIPPSSPVYNIKFVYIYDYNTDLVYVGYTGGYTGSFLYQGCLFYGTGYHYKPWYKSKYYSRPLTFAFGVNRTYSNSNVSISVGVGYGYPGFYSPYGGYGYGFGSYGYATLNGNFDYKQGYERKKLDPLNIYNNRAQGIIRTEQVRRNNPFNVLPANQQLNNGDWVPPTNMYADADGNVYQQGKDGAWQKRSDGVWVKIEGRPAN